MIPRVPVWRVPPVSCMCTRNSPVNLCLSLAINISHKIWLSHIQRRVTSYLSMSRCWKGLQNTPWLQQNSARVHQSVQCLVSRFFWVNMAIHGSALVGLRGLACLHVMVMSFHQKRQYAFTEDCFPCTYIYFRRHENQWCVSGVSLCWIFHGGCSGRGWLSPNPHLFSPLRILPFPR